MFKKILQPVFDNAIKDVFMSSSDAPSGDTPTLWTPTINSDYIYDWDRQSGYVQGVTDTWLDSIAGKVLSATSSAKPVLGVDAVEFNGTSHIMHNTQASGYQSLYAKSGGVVTFSVTKVLSLVTGASRMLLSESDSASNNSHYAFQRSNSSGSRNRIGNQIRDTSSVIRLNADTTTPNAPDLWTGEIGSNNPFFSISCVRDKQISGTNYQVTTWVNGTKSVTVSVNRVTASVPWALNLNTIAIGGIKRPTPGLYFNGNVAKISVFSANITDDFIDKMIGWLAWRYGSQSYLPNNHLYKNSPPVV
jgi:hypothetical protein